MGHCLPSLVMEWAVVFIVLGKPILVILFTKGPMKAGMFLTVGRESKRVFSVLRMFKNDFSICDMRGSSFIAVDHLCSELVGVLRLFVFAFIHILWIIKIESKIPFEFEDGVIPQFRVRKVLVFEGHCCAWQYKSFFFFYILISFIFSLSHFD